MPLKLDQKIARTELKKNSKTRADSLITILRIRRLGKSLHQALHAKKRVRMTIISFVWRVLAKKLYQNMRPR